MTFFFCNLFVFYFCVKYFRITFMWILCKSILQLFKNVHDLCSIYCLKKCILPIGYSWYVQDLVSDDMILFTYFDTNMFMNFYIFIVILFYIFGIVKFLRITSFDDCLKSIINAFSAALGGSVQDLAGYDCDHEWIYVQDCLKSIYCLRLLSWYVYDL